MPLTYCSYKWTFYHFSVSLLNNPHINTFVALSDNLLSVADDSLQVTVHVHILQWTTVARQMIFVLSYFYLPLYDGSYTLLETCQVLLQ